MRLWHFHREEEINLQLGEAHRSPSLELDVERRHASDDHDLLLDKLDSLMGRLNELDPPFHSWESAIDELELFVDLLEKHESQERESILTLVRLDSDRAAKRLPVVKSESSGK